MTKPNLYMALKIQRNEVWIKHIIRDVSGYTRNSYTRSFTRNSYTRNRIAATYREFTIFIDGSAESLHKIEYVEYRLPSTFPVSTIRTHELWTTKKDLVRKVPVIGMRDWLLIYEDTLLELSVKDAYELEIVVV